MQEDKSYFEKNFFIAIGEDGKITSVPRAEGEKAHLRPFKRLNEKLGNVIEINNGILNNLANIFAKRGFIIIFPFQVWKGVKADFILVFPFKPTKEQLNALTTLYSALETVKIYYFEKPNADTDLNFKEIIEGFVNLKKFVQEKLDLYKNQINKEEEFEKV